MYLSFSIFVIDIFFSASQLVNNITNNNTTNVNISYGELFIIPLFIHPMIHIVGLHTI